jgi:hypothetical protein
LPRPSKPPPDWLPAEREIHVERESLVGFRGGAKLTRAREEGEKTAGSDKGVIQFTRTFFFFFLFLFSFLFSRADKFGLDC